MTFKPKVGLISCSGEDCIGGSVSRAATLRVLHQLKPDETVTICLPLFIAGDADEREFARVFPTITIDGCSKMCAALQTAKYSAEPSARICVEDYLPDACSPAKGKWKIDEFSDIVERVAADVASAVDSVRDRWR
ncbi:MAG: putative zinc-binding protein [Candidatus Thorarchaeota archaeon]